ncbi:uncharacterized [Tachysurus ichikawai]
MAGFWTELHPSKEAKDISSVSVGGAAGRHSHHTGDRRHHLTRPVLLSAAGRRQRRGLAAYGSGQKNLFMKAVRGSESGRS